MGGREHLNSVKTWNPQLLTSGPKFTLSKCYKAIGKINKRSYISGGFSTKNWKVSSDLSSVANTGNKSPSFTFCLLAVTKTVGDCDIAFKKPGYLVASGEKSFLNALFQGNGNA